jgi:hypothetical protein
MRIAGPTQPRLMKASRVRLEPARPRFQVPELTTTRPVIAHTTTVSQNVPVEDTNAWRTGFFRAAAATSQSLGRSTSATLFRSRSSGSCRAADGTRTRAVPDSEGVHGGASHPCTCRPELATFFIWSGRDPVITTEAARAGRQDEHAQPCPEHRWGHQQPKRRATRSGPRKCTLRRCTPPALATMQSRVAYYGARCGVHLGRSSSQSQTVSCWATLSRMICHLACGGWQWSTRSGESTRRV